MMLKFNCPICNQEINENNILHLMTSNDAVCCIDSDSITSDMEYINHVKNYGGTPPNGKFEKQVAFNKDTVSQYKFIKHNNGKFYFTNQFGTQTEITSYACPTCHSNLSEVRKADSSIPVFLVGRTAASKTTLIISAYVSCSNELAFPSGTFEGHYYKLLADKLRNKQVPNPTPTMKERSTRQPAASFQVVKDNGKRVHLTLLDHPGERIKENITVFNNSIIALLVDGETPLENQENMLIDYVNKYKDYVRKFVVVVTKCDKYDDQSLIDRLMLAEFEKQKVFKSFSDLHAARSIAFLYYKFDPLKEFVKEIRNRSQKPTELVFCAALGCSADSNGKLLGTYKPRYVKDLLRTLAEE